MIGYAIQQASNFLDKTQNGDGGWGYLVGNLSAVEPTALALMARSSQNAWEKGVAWLLRVQRDDGGWGVNEQDDDSNWLTLWATWALLIAAVEDVHLAASRGIEWLLEIPVLRITDPNDTADIMGTLNIDPGLAGWPWRPDEATFVEPTALAVLALMAADAIDHPRLLEGIDYLYDRTCQEGGWNIGNPFMFDKALFPTPHSTSLVLLALRAVGADDKKGVISQSVGVLREILSQQVTAGSLALGLLALQVWQIEDTSLINRLLAMQSQDGGWESSPYATATALLAMRGVEQVISFGG